MPVDNKIKKTLLYKAHNTVFTLQRGGNKVYQDLK